MQQLNPSEISDLIKQRIDQLEVTSQATNEAVSYTHLRAHETV